ncbi:oxidoreductase family protein [Xylariaceae sp. FL0662B]|nr:oxidoreductase family protein [Xylariaceae sp. FL0662B]
METLGIAIIGSGIFAREQHIPAALASPLISIKAIWSRSLKSAEEAAKLIPGDAGASVELYSADAGKGKSYEDILKRDDVTGLILALPIIDQPKYIEKALAAGKHVLAEKPIAKDVASAVKLVEYYKKVSVETKASLAIAENFRFSKGWGVGAEEIKKLGKVTGFVVRLNSMMQTSNKYYNTAWRTKPEYQGGFLLDSGVHFTAALRKLLGSENAIESLIAQTSLACSHLPPVDTINAVLKTKSGVVGSYIHSVGTAMQAFEFHVACEQGVVKAEGSKVTTIRGFESDAVAEEKVFEQTSGVKEEVQAWAESVLSGVPNPDQTPELALADLELVEKMLTSGDRDGARQKLQYQHFV